MGDHLFLILKGNQHLLPFPRIPRGRLVFPGCCRNEGSVWGVVTEIRVSDVAHVPPPSPDPHCNLVFTQDVNVRTQV